MSSLENLDKAETEGNVSQKNAAESNKEAGNTAANDENSTESKKDNAETTDKKSTLTVFQFKIILQHSKPPIWRRIQVPQDFNFRQFHQAILRAMGWSGAHLHIFRFSGPRGKAHITIGPNSLDYEAFDDDTQDLNEVEEKLSDYFPGEKVVHYEYDFGDCWEHKILFEGEMPEKEGGKYPTCIAGKRACPPDDCGGVGGYEDLLHIIQNPQHREHEEMKSWLEDTMGKHDFDPAKFDPKAVTFW